MTSLNDQKKENIIDDEEYMAQEEAKEYIIEKEDTYMDEEYNEDDYLDEDIYMEEYEMNVKNKKIKKETKEENDNNKKEDNENKQLQQEEKEMKKEVQQVETETNKEMQQEDKEMNKKVRADLSARTGKKRYTYDEMMGMNNVDLSNIDLTLIGFFNSLPIYSITKEMRFHFPNRCNVHFNKRRVRPKAVISDDPVLVKKLRSCLSKISPQNMESMTKQINEILGSQNYDWKDVSEHVYTSAIDNIFLVDIFVKLMIELNKTRSQLIHHMHHLIKEEVYKPRVFENTLSEDGVGKNKRYQLSNSILITEIFMQGKYSEKYMLGLLDYWLSSINVDNLIPLEILIKILPKLTKLQISKELVEKLNSVSKDKAYPTRLRLLLNLPKKT